MQHIQIYAAVPGSGGGDTAMKVQGATGVGYGRGKWAGIQQYRY